MLPFKESIVWLTHARQSVTGIARTTGTSVASLCVRAVLSTAMCILSTLINVVTSETIWSKSISRGTVTVIWAHSVWALLLTGICVLCALIDVWILGVSIIIVLRLLFSAPHLYTSVHHWLSDSRIGKNRCNFLCCLCICEHSHLYSQHTRQHLQPNLFQVYGRTTKLSSYLGRSFDLKLIYNQSYNYTSMIP